MTLRLAVTLAGLLLALSGSAWLGWDYRGAVDARAAAEQAANAKQRAAAQAGEYEHERERIGEFQEAVRSELARWSRGHPLPAGCRPDPERLRHLNAALAGPGQPAAAVPGAGGAPAPR